jgi:hypothetical protein
VTTAAVQSDASGSAGGEQACSAAREGAGPAARGGASGLGRGLAAVVFTQATVPRSQLGRLGVGAG